LLEQRPGAFEYARPLRAFRREWPPAYHRLLQRLKENWPEGRGVKEFVRVLRLHQEHSARLIEQAVERALEYGCVHADGVIHCLHALEQPQLELPALDLSEQPHLAEVGMQPVQLQQYEQLVERMAHA